MSRTVPRRHPTRRGFASSCALLIGLRKASIDSQTILITGCSSGIGRATALCAHERKHTTVATARKLESLDDLPESIHKVALDVTEPASVTEAMRSVTATLGAPTALVNNAGYAEVGPVELVPHDRVEREFETNVYGPLRMIRACLPAMREAGSGTIVNVSSLAALISAPFMGVYCASKAALEAYSDSLRLELRSSGINVALIEPGPIRTRFSETAFGDARERWLDNPDNPYAAGMQRTVRLMDKLTRVEAEASDVAATIIGAIENPHPKARYPVSVPAHVLPALLGVVPTRLQDKLSERILGL